jgi:hypothetical protein
MERRAPLPGSKLRYHDAGKKHEDFNEKYVGIPHASFRGSNVDGQPDDKVKKGSRRTRAALCIREIEVLEDEHLKKGDHGGCGGRSSLVSFQRFPSTPICPLSTKLRASWTSV